MADLDAGKKTAIDEPDKALLDADNFSFNGAMESMSGALIASDSSIKAAMKKLQNSNNPNPANLASMQFRINKWTLNFNLFSSMMKSIKDVSSGTIQKI
jgi:type III secretion apparatus needle protein